MIKLKMNKRYPKTLGIICLAGLFLLLGWLLLLTFWPKPPVTPAKTITVEGILKVDGGRCHGNPNGPAPLIYVVLHSTSVYLYKISEETKSSTKHQAPQVENTRVKATGTLDGTSHAMCIDGKDISIPILQVTNSEEL